MWPFSRKPVPTPEGTMIAIAKADVIGAVKLEAKPVEVKVGPAMLDSDFASLEAAELAIGRIVEHLAYRKKIGKDQSLNCDQLRLKHRKLEAFVAAMKVGE